MCIATPEMTLVSRPKLTIAITVHKNNPELRDPAMTVIDTGRVCAHHLQRKVAVHTFTYRRNRLKLSAGMCRARLDATGVARVAETTWQPHPSHGAAKIVVGLVYRVIGVCILQMSAVGKPAGPSALSGVDMLEFLGFLVARARCFPAVGSRCGIPV